MSLSLPLSIKRSREEGSAAIELPDQKQTKLFDITCTLPEELLSHIFSTLPSSDLFEVRLVSKKWCRISTERLTHLNVTRRNFPALIPQIRYLQSLRFSRCSLYGGEINELKLYPSTRSLEFVDCKGLIDATLHQVLPRTPQLNTLIMKRVYLSDLGLKAISTYCTKLQALHLNDEDSEQSDCVFTHNGFIPLFTNCTELTSLSLSSLDIDRKTLRDLPKQLTSLTINSCFVLDALDYSYLSRCTLLEELTISCELRFDTTPSKIALKDIFNSCKKLRKIHLININCVNEKTILKILKVYRFQLQDINLSLCSRLSETGIALLCHFPQLVNIDISYTKANDDSVMQIFLLCLKLRKINMIGSKVSHLTQQAIQSSLGSQDMDI